MEILENMVKESGSINNLKDLTERIRELEQRRTHEETGLKVKFHEVLVSFKPVNIISGTIKDIQESAPLKKGLFKLAVGLGVGYMSKKLVMGKPAGSFAKILGSAIQYGIAGIISRNEPSINEEETQYGVISTATHFIKNLFSKKKEKEEKADVYRDINL